MEEFRKAKLVQANAPYEKLEGAARANVEKLRLAGFWGTPEEAAACSAAAADPDPFDLAAYGSQSLGEEGLAL
jgi:hypothetical protein